MTVSNAGNISIGVSNPAIVSDSGFCSSHSCPGIIASIPIRFIPANEVASAPYLHLLFTFTYEFLIFKSLPYALVALSLTVFRPIKV